MMKQVLLFFSVFQLCLSVPGKAQIASAPIADSSATHKSGKQAHTTLKLVRSYSVPILLTGYGLIAIGPSKTFYDRFDAKRDIQKQYPGFHNTLDNYLQFVPAATVFSLSLCGVKGKHNLTEQVILYSGSMALSIGIATGLKYATHTLRPDGSTYNSFPSGHTTSAFTGAEVMNQEYGGTCFLYSIFGYGTASATGMMRMMNNRHWMSDVLVGAGIGMISTKVFYAVYPALKRRFYHPKVHTAIE
jgi:membrane-associated phospholipid phosphatase